LDGIVARMLEQTTPLGEFLDPVADKLMVAVALILIVGEKSLYFITIPAAIIVGREIAVSALREWMAELGKRASIAVSYIGKAKTLIQMLAVTLLLIYKPGEHWSLLLSGYTLLYLAAILTLWSMFVYLKAAWPALTE
ncbi:MAG: CDP-diacylglycerol--glycerol-3-phosphate 3-phosphatidyltransferase, partial [Gammaproteobacteria bacterium]